MRKTILVGLGLLAMAGGAQAQDDSHCKAVRLADIGWTDVTAATAVAAQLFKALGYAPKVVSLTVPATYQGMQRKQVDGFLGNWMPTMDADRKPYLDDKSVEVLQPNLEGAKFTLAVPQYTYDKGLHDFADIQKFAKELNYKIYGLEEGNDGNRHIQDLIKAHRFGLDKFTVVESGETWMLAQVEKAFRGAKPIVFIGWEPHPMNRLYRMQYLTGGDDSFGPDFGSATVYTNIRAGYAAECPNAARLLANLHFDTAMEDEWMDAILNHAMSPAKAASSWLHANKAVVERWVDGMTMFDGASVEPALGKL